MSATRLVRSAAVRARRMAAPMAPGHRRWVRFLKSLPLDPDALPRPLQAPLAQDFIICGSPRTGTTLVCGALFQPPRVLTVMEPWDGMRLAPAPLFASLREEIASDGRLRRGRLDVGRLLEAGEVRWCAEGTPTPPVAADPDHLLGVKWPGYWRYLDLLPDTRFVVCLRDPYETIASYANAGGRVAEGLQYATRFNAGLNTRMAAATSDVRLRRVLLFDHIHERILPHLGRANVFPLRYERWFDDRAALLAELSGFLGTDVTAVPARIRDRRDAPPLPAAERDLIRTHCTTAAALGYELTP